MDIDYTALFEYESGDLSAEDTMDLFADLVRTGAAWKLQGHYGRTATQMIEQGYITADGEVNQEAVNAMLENLEG